MKLLNAQAQKEGKVLMSDYAGMQSTDMQKAWGKLVASGEAEQLPDGSWAFIKPKTVDKVEPPITETKTEPVPEVVKEETVQAVTKKLDKQSAIKDDKIFKEQKNQLLDDQIGRAHV